MSIVKGCVMNLNQGNISKVKVTSHISQIRVQAILVTDLTSSSTKSRQCKHFDGISQYFWLVTRLKYFKLMYFLSLKKIHVQKYHNLPLKCVHWRDLVLGKIRSVTSNSLLSCWIWKLPKSIDTIRYALYSVYFRSLCINVHVYEKNAPLLSCNNGTQCTENQNLNISIIWVWQSCGLLHHFI